MANQMRPIARNLKPPPLPKFVQDPSKEVKFSVAVLPFQSVKKVRISHYDNGPFMFYVQLESAESEFQRFIAKLQKTELRHLKSRPNSLGMACLARHDKKIYRAAIAKCSQNPAQENFLVNFVDFGFNASVKLENLFHIPDEFLQFTFAMPFSLAGLKASELKVNEKEVAFFFRQLTENRLVTLKCIAFDGPPICQYCELFLDDNTKVLDKLKQFDPYNLKLPQQGKLEMKIAFDVKVSYVENAQEFYVHVQRPEILADYDATCDEFYKTMSRSLLHRNPKPGSCCAVLLSGEWYRGQVVGVKNQSVQVKIVDYGIIEEVPEKQVFLLPQKLAEKAPFAFRCCLKGFEGLEVSENIGTQFEIFCGDGRGERKVFKMTIDSFNEFYSVELEDASVTPPVNVNKMLLKNSRPLIETIQLENAKKRQKETRQEEPSGRDRNNSQRGRGNHMNKGGQRRHHDESSTGTFYKTNKEGSAWSSKESTPSENFNKTSDWDAPKQKSSKSWIDEKTKKTGWVSTLLSVNRAFVHFDEHIEGLEKILDEMFAFYENKNSRPHLKDFNIGADCASRSNDGNWYRSRIESVRGENVKVFHREYGNSEVLHKSKLRLLDLKFAAMEELAVSTYFAIKPETDVKSLFSELAKIFEDGAKEFNFKLVQKFRDGWILEPIDPVTGKNVIDELVRTKKAQKIGERELLEILDGARVEREAEKREKKSPKRVKPEVVADKPETAGKKSEPEKEVKTNSAQTKKDVSIKPEPDIVIKEPEVEPKTKQNSSKPNEVRKTPPRKSKRKSPETSTPKKPSPRTPIRLTALTSPTDFYISLANETSKFVKLHADIQIIASGAAPLKDFEESTLCLAQQPFDNFWYRARIIDSDEEVKMVTVRCLDDGKTFSVENFEFLKIMPAELAQKKFFGISCLLPIKIERKCEENATNFMMQMMDDELEVEFVTESFVELFRDGENVADSLVEQKFAKRLEMIEAGKAYTSHINSTSSFYLQFESEQLKLDLISQYFEVAKGEFVEVQDAKPGDVVAALFPDDNCWYRTRIEDVDDSKFTVTFIDYGNVCEVEKIGKISEATIVELPKMSKHCCLSKPKGLKKFSDEADKKFEEICANGATILEVKMKKPGDPVEVEVFLKGKNIVDDLIALCEPSDYLLDKTLESNDGELDVERII